MKKRNKTGILIFLTSCFIYACDPGHYATTFVANNTEYPLLVNFTTNRFDTVITIYANETKQIYAAGGIGSGSDYDCCTCRFLSISIDAEDVNKDVVKVISDPANWDLQNPNKGRFSSKEIQCTFYVEDEHIQ